MMLTQIAVNVEYLEGVWKGQKREALLMAWHLDVYLICDILTGLIFEQGIKSLRVTAILQRARPLSIRPGAAH